MILKNIINKYLENNKKTIDILINAEKKEIISSARLIINTINANKKILICGNGGSASDAQHFAAELIGRFKKDRPSLPAMALNTDTSAITAIANDFNYETVFARQIQGIGNKEDILLAISTSGNSRNILEAVKAAKKKKLVTIGLTGKNSSLVSSKSDYCIFVSSKETSHIQELHIIVLHILCILIEKKL